LLAGFLESYHTKFFLSKSIKGKQNEQELQTVLSDPSIAKLQRENKRIIKMVLRDYYRRIRLVDRLREIFNEYKYLLLLNIPILSYISAEQQLDMSVSKLILDESTKNQILNTIKKKKKLDLNTMEGNEKYKVIIEDLLKKKNAGIRKKIVEYALSQSTDDFPQDISKLRNAIAHVKEEFKSMESDIWVLAVRTLELIGLLCILTQLGFRKRQGEIPNEIVDMKKSFKGAQKNILVVDDDLDIIDPIKLWLQKNGFAVSEFTDPINEKTVAIKANISGSYIRQTI
jgi:CheY-like chemotaxis protein